MPRNNEEASRWEDRLPPGEANKFAEMQSEGKVSGSRCDMFRSFLKERKKMSEVRRGIGSGAGGNDANISKDNSQTNTKKNESGSAEKCKFCSNAAHRLWMQCCQERKDYCKREDACYICLKKNAVCSCKRNSRSRGRGKQASSDATGGPALAFSNSLRPAKCLRCKFILEQPRDCGGCGKKTTAHCLAHCPTYMEGGVAEKTSIVKKIKACAVCLFPGHETAKCRNQDNPDYVCGIGGCKSHHPPTLHGSKDPAIQKIHAAFVTLRKMCKEDMTLSASSETAKELQRADETRKEKLSEGRRILMTSQVIPLKYGEDGRQADLNTLWDDGSTISVIKNSLAAKYCLPGEDIVVNLGTVTDTKRISTKLYEIELVDRGGGVHIIHAIGLPGISGDIPPVKVSGSLQTMFSIEIQHRWKELENRPTGEFELLIGSEVAAYHPRFHEAVGHLVVKRSPLFGCEFVFNGSHPLISGEGTAFTDEVEASRLGFIVEMNHIGVSYTQTADDPKFKDSGLIKEESCSSLREAAPGCVALLRDSAEEHLDEGAVFPSIPLEMQQVVGTRPTSQVSAKPSIIHKVNDHETLQNLFETTCPYKPTLDLKCSYHHQSMLISPDSDVSGTNLMEEVWTESEDPSSAEDVKPEPAKDFCDKSPTKTSANLAKKGGQIRGEVLNNLTVHSSADLEDYVQSSQDFVGRKEPEDHDKKSDAKEHCSKMSREDFLKYESEDSIGSNDEEAKEKLPDEYYSTTSKDDFLKIEEVFLMRQLDLKPPDFTFYYNQIDQSNFSSNQLPPTAADAEVAGRAQQERQLQVPASAVNCSSSTNQQQITASGYNSCKNSAIGQKVLLQDPSQGSPQIAKTSSLQNLGETSLPQDVSQRSLPQNTSQRSLALNKKENLVLQKYEFGQETNSRKTDYSANTEAETKTAHNIVWKDIAKASTAKGIMKVKKKFDLSMNKEDKINHNFEWKDIAKASTSNVRYNTTTNPLKRPNHVSDVVNNWCNKENYKSPSTENVLILPKEDQEQELQVQDQELADAASGCAALTSSLARKDLGYAIKAP